MKCPKCGDILYVAYDNVSYIFSCKKCGYYEDRRYLISPAEIAAAKEVLEYDYADVELYINERKSGGPKIYMKELAVARWEKLKNSGPVWRQICEEIEKGDQ